ncbi:MAG: hypothetical protein ACLPND_03850 [Candidatus Korobacteraceae bacterium]
MKNVTLFACLLVPTLGASAQTARTVSPIAIPPNARGGEKHAVGITVADHAVSGQSATAAKPAANGGPQGPPVVKQPPNAVQVPPTAKK